MSSFFVDRVVYSLSFLNDDDIITLYNKTIGHDHPEKIIDEETVDYENLNAEDLLYDIANTYEVDIMGIDELYDWFINDFGLDGDHIYERDGMWVYLHLDELHDNWW